LSCTFNFDVILLLLVGLYGKSRHAVASGQIEIMFYYLSRFNCATQPGFLLIVQEVTYPLADSLLLTATEVALKT
jgi:hypothetical protein